MALKFNPLTGSFDLDTISKSPATRIVAPSGSGYAADYYTDGTSDNVQIQLALDAIHTLGKGSVRIVEGSYSISAPLVIYSNTEINAVGATITLASGKNCNMLIDSAHSSGSGSVSNITIIGGIWDRVFNAGVNNNTHSIILGGDNIIAKDMQMKSQAGKYSILLQNCTNFLVENIYCNTTKSDGVHVQGPSSHGIIRNIFGTTGDDMVAITPMDYVAYTWGNEGDVTDIIIENVFPYNCATNAVKVLSGVNGSTVLNTSRIIIRNVVGTMDSTLVAAVYLGDDSSNVGTRDGQISDILVDGIKVGFSDSTKPIINITGDTNSLTIPNITLRNISVLNDCSSVINYNTKITNLIVDGVSGSTTTSAMTGVVWFKSAFNLIKQLYLNNVNITFAGTQGGNLIKATTAGMELDEVYLSNIYIKNAFWLMDIDTTTTVSITNLHQDINSGIFNIRADSAITIVGCVGSTFYQTSSTIALGGTLESKSIRFPLNVSQTGVLANLGDLAYNTNSGAAAGIGSVGYNGTSWEPLAIPQDIYTTSSPTFAGLTVGNIAVTGNATRDITVARSASGAGVGLTLQAGGALSGSTNTAAGSLVLASGLGTGNVGAPNVSIKVAEAGGSTGTADQVLNTVAFFQKSSSTQWQFILNSTTTGQLGHGISIRGQNATTIGLVPMTTSNTAGSSLTINAGSATSGATDKGGGDLILKPGLSTGVGRSNLRLQTYDIISGASTGTGNNTALDRMIITSPKILTDGSAINLINFTLASNTVIGSIIRYAVEVFDGTNLQMETGEIMVQCANKGGVFSGNTVTQIGSAKQFLGSGTLTMTWAITAANPAVLSLNADTSLTASTGYPRITYSVENFTQQAIAIQ
jgi:hypothetical protein